MTWSRKHTTGRHQLWCFRDSHFWTVRWLLQLLPLQGCDAIPLCHFQSSFDVLALSHVTSPSGIWFLTSLRDGQWYSRCFPVPPSVWQPLHFLLIRPTSIIQSFLHPSSFHDQPPHHIPVRVCPRFVGLTPQHSLGGLQPHSFFQLLTLVLCGPFLPIDHPGLLQKHLFLRIAGTLTSTACPSKSKVCHCGHVMPRSRVSRMTAPAGPLTCLHVCASKLCFLRASCCSLSPSAHPHAFRPKERIQSG